MSILALDLGTKLGYAIRSDSGAIVSGTIDFSNRRYEGGGMRYLKFERWLEETHQAAPIKEVVFEEVRRHLSTDSSHVYGGLLGILTAFCEKKGIPYQGVSIGTIKKHATGKGNAGKPEMIAAARSRGFDPKDDNTADAIALLFYHLDQIGV